jgi:flagellar M-ring protein FliF
MSFQAVLEQFKTVFNKLTLLQKISIIFATIAVFLSVVVLIVWANKPVYRTLYANMNADDAGLVISKLKEKKIPYKLKDNGKTVEVPQDKVYEIRINLAQEGIPRGSGSGFELFDKTSFGTTEFVQNVNYQRALQGELARTIASLNEIAEARVHLTIPKEKLFINEDTEAKAAIVVKLRSGATLNRNTVNSIASLVAGAVKGLKKENVQIVDTNGRLLSEFLDEETPYMLTQTQLEYQKKIEKALEAKANSILKRTLGSNNAFAKITTEIDFDKKSYTKEEYDPNGVLRSQQTFEETSNTKPRKPVGVPGVESNLAEPNINNQDMTTEYSKTDERQNFEIGKTVSTGEKAIGTIKRMTIAVVLNDKKVVKGDGKNKKIEYKPRTKEEIEKIKELVASATGYNKDRGDLITVSNISFDTSEQAQEVALIKKEKTMQLISMAIKYFSGIIIILLFYLLVIKPILKKLDQLKESKEGQLVLSGAGASGDNLDITIGDDMKFPKTIEELEKEIESELEESVPVDVDSVKTKVMLKKIEEAAQQDPEMLANLIKAWLREG